MIRAERKRQKIIGNSKSRLRGIGDDSAGREELPPQASTIPQDSAPESDSQAIQPEEASLPSPSGTAEPQSQVLIERANPAPAEEHLPSLEAYRREMEMKSRDTNDEHPTHVANTPIEPSFTGLSKGSPSSRPVHTALPAHPKRFHLLHQLLALVFGVYFAFVLRGFAPYYVSPIPALLLTIATTEFLQYRGGNSATSNASLGHQHFPCTLAPSVCFRCRSLAVAALRPCSSPLLPPRPPARRCRCRHVGRRLRSRTVPGRVRGRRQQQAVDQPAKRWKGEGHLPQRRRL